MELLQMKCLTERELLERGSPGPLSPTAYKEWWSTPFWEASPRDRETRIFGRGDDLIHLISAHEVARCRCDRFGPASFRIHKILLSTRRIRTAAICRSRLRAWWRIRGGPTLFEFRLPPRPTPQERRSEATVCYPFARRI